MLFRIEVEHTLSRTKSNLKNKKFSLEYDNKACKFIDSLERSILPAIEEVFNGDFPKFGNIVIKMSFKDDEFTQEKGYEYTQSVRQFMKRYNKSIEDNSKFGYSPTFISYLCFDFILSFLESSLNHIFHKMIKEFEKLDIVI